MILPNKQSKRDSTNRQQNCVCSKPKLVIGKPGEADRSNYEKNDSGDYHPAEDMQGLQPGVDRVAQYYDVFEALAKGNYWRQDQDQFGKAGDTR